MFHIDEFVIHPTGGICRVADIGPLAISGADKDKKYYFLVPLRERGGKVFVPVTTADDTIRKVMTDSQAWELIDAIPNIEEAVIESDKVREARYKEAIKSLDCRELVKILKNLYTRKKKRISEGKKNTATDEKYFKLAQESLFSELAFATGKEKNEVFSIIQEKIGDLQ